MLNQKCVENDIKVKMCKSCAHFWHWTSYIKTLCSKLCALFLYDFGHRYIHCICIANASFDKNAKNHSDFVILCPHWQFSYAPKTPRNACEFGNAIFFLSRNIVVAVCYSCRPVLTHSLSQKSKLTQLFNWALGCGTRTKKIRSLSCDVYILNVAMMTHNGAMQAIQCSASICAKNKPTMKKTKKKKKKNKQQYPGHNINKWQR